MGTPETRGAIHDALSDLGGLLVPAHIRANFTSSATVLDVGAGWGKYGRLLPEFKDVDAVEIWKPYIEENNLEQQYRQVFNEDICDLHDIWYDIIIMGDVLEHIDKDKAVLLMEKLKESSNLIYVIIPYEYHQGEVNGNKYEIHLQDDLTDASIRSLYGLKLLAKDDVKGVYIS